MKRWSRVARGASAKACGVALAWKACVIFGGNDGRKRLCGDECQRVHRTVGVDEGIYGIERESEVAF